MIIFLNLLSIDAIHAPCKPKVTNLDGAVVVDEYVGWFQVPMDDFRLVEIIQATEYVIYDRLDLRFLQMLSRFNKFA